MKELDLYLFKKFFLLTSLIAGILTLTHGCGNDAGIPLVDFSKTVNVKRPGDQVSDYPLLRVAVGAMISPKETAIYYRQLLDYIGSKLDRKINFIQRKTYGEISELIGKGDIDLAFICSGPYVAGKEKYGFDILATPQIQGSHFYQAYLIVNKNSPFQHFEDLKERVFAFTDPDSNTGKLVPTYWLAKNGEQPKTFFKKTIYTYSHDNSIQAVARGLVEGASVDGLIWEYYNFKNPIFTSKTRIIKKSEPYGIPPIVVSDDIPQDVKEQIRQVLFSMHKESNGKSILRELMIDRFIEPQEEWYEPILQMGKQLALIGDQ